MGGGLKRSIHILLVEDNAGDALLMTSLFKETDPTVEVRVASDGQAAIDFLVCRHARPDAVILDINLPRKNGFEVLAEIRNLPELKTLPVFIASGSRADEDMKKCYSLGVASFITKPSELSEFEDVVKRFLVIDLPRALQRNKTLERGDEERNGT